MGLVLLRHASAGDRAAWRGADRERPLDERGERQARKLVARLSPYAVDAIYTSPYLRCLQTVVPLARARGLEPIVAPELGEDRQHDDGIALVRALAGRDVLVCGHGGLEHALAAPPKWRKGAAFLVGDDLSVVAEL
jgi:phosphohistidine phosphatase SixA